MFSNKNITEERLNKQNILKYVSEYSIYQYYIPDLNIGSVICSPLREDNNPSFGIFIGKYGDLAYNDYKLGGGDVIKFVSTIENVSRYEAMKIINYIFQLHLICNTTNRIFKTQKPSLLNSNIKKLKKKKPKISIRIRDWNQDDVDYLNPLDIKKLKNWFPIDFFWIDSQIFNTDKLAYAFRYGINIYKIYQPNLQTKHGKWWSNIDVKTHWFGHNLLPKKGNLLFVCSSNKDASVLHQLGYNAIAPHTESQIFSETQYKEYSKRFLKIIVFYDNDETGLLKAKKFSDIYNLDYIYLEDQETKDPFEFIKMYSMEDLNNFIKEYI